MCSLQVKQACIYILLETPSQENVYMINGANRHAYIFLNLIQHFTGICCEVCYETQMPDENQYWHQVSKHIKPIAVDSINYNL